MTSKLPRQLSGRELIKILGKFGFKVKRVGRGSHVFLFKAEKGKKLITSVPYLIWVSFAMVLNWYIFVLN